MFKRPHHQRILHVLRALDHELLTRAHCYFGGGTAIVLTLGEYRESVDIDFLCADLEGYRQLRAALALPTLGALVTQPVRYLREVRTDRDKISTFLDVDGTPIKLEFVLEARITLTGASDQALRVPVLSRQDMYAEKLLANTDRGLDRSTLSRDLIDLGMMIDAWGPIPETAWQKCEAAYGGAVRSYFNRCVSLLLENRAYLADCMQTMSMSPELADRLVGALASQRQMVAPSKSEL